MNQAPQARYSAVAMILHWLIAIGVIAQWRIAVAAENAPSREAGRAIMENHYALGLTILMLVLLRLAWRLVAPNPPIAAHPAPWERLLAKITHTLFYVLLIAMPLAGWLAKSMVDSPVSIWGLFEMPVLPVVHDPETAKAIFGAHAAAGVALLILVAIHILGTLKHTLLDRDGNLFRMLPFGTPRA